MIDDYQFKTEPYDHQREVFALSRLEPSYAYLMEMGTGKSKPLIDNAAYLYGLGKIRLLVVIAPNGVHRNWVRKEIPVHMPDHIQYRAAYWGSSLKKAEKAQLAALDDPDFHGLRILTVNVEAFATKRATEYVKGMLRIFPAMLCVDEGTTIKSPGAKRTEAIVNLGGLARYRRLLNGTPVTQSPLDLFAQFAFLDPNIIGHGSYYSFRNRYAQLEEKKTYRPDPVTGLEKVHRFQVVTGFQRLDELVDKIRPYSYRKEKSECLDLPEKILRTRTIELSKEQRRLYNELKREAQVDIGDAQVLTPHHLTKLLRLQQILGGWVTTEDPLTMQTQLVPVPGPNLRLKALEEEIEQIGGKAIIWARFRAEIEAITNLLREKYGHEAVVEYHGGIKAHDRADGIDAFESGPARFFVGQPHAGKYGFTLNAAGYVFWYSCDFSLDAYEQANDRCHRIGQDKNVVYTHFIADGTIDAQLVKALTEKRDLAKLITEGLKE